MSYVIHYRIGRTRTVPDMPQIDASSAVVTTSDGERIAFADLKAVFCLTGGHETSQATDDRSLTVEFLDGEKIRGSSTDYSPDRSSFFLIPADRSKNDRIFVVRDAIATIDLE